VPPPAGLLLRSGGIGGTGFTGSGDTINGVEEERELLAAIGIAGPASGSAAGARETEEELRTK